jgi:hypothetical protein
MTESFKDKAERLGVPLIGGKDNWPEPNFDANPIIGICGKCGLELHKVMHYFCSRSNCPTGLGSKFR